MKRGTTFMIALAGAILYLAPGAQAFECGTVLDTFTRANSSDLGPNWTEQAPDPAIAAQGFTVAAAQTGLATFNGVTSNEACVDVASAPTGTNYAAIDLRYGGLTNNVFVKLQGNGAFTQVWFYKGNNGIAWNPTANPHAVPAFTAARFHVSSSGTTVTADIDTNFDNQPEQTIVEQNLPTSGLGALIGLGAYGNPRLDNFAIPKKDAPPSFSCDGQTATLVGSDQRDSINGTPARDVIASLGGNDLVRGLAGKDLICGGDGRDKLLGGKGKDKLLGDAGKDKLFGGKGKDELLGDAGKDKLFGGPKGDECIGGPGTDKLKSC